jgi:hypothetical protein
VATVQNQSDREITRYFDGGEIGENELIVDGLKEMTFGEYLVEQGAVTRAQLLRAMMEQDQNPGIPIGEIVAWLGYVPYEEVDRLLTQWSAMPVVEVDR